ncbi:hypothetical protein BGX34_002022 [Mortierella sp. NVP85]|nr:hypothetical protein BGX34_002022 [Mortierella sp. NVP85]
MLVWCYEVEVSLSQAQSAAKRIKDKALHNEIGALYTSLGELLDSKGFKDVARAFYKKSTVLGSRTQGSGQNTTSIVYPIDDGPTAAPPNIFPTNVRPPAIDFNPPEPDARLIDTLQLACCLELLQADVNPCGILDTTACDWLRVTKDDPDEKERLIKLATDVIRAFKRDEFKNAKVVAEVVCLAPALEKDDFRYLVSEFYSGIGQAGLLDIHQLEGLACLLQGAQGARCGYLDADDLVRILGLLKTRLEDTHQQSTNHLYQLTLAVSHVLDAMADAGVKDLDREMIHEPLSAYLDWLKGSSDPYLVYQAAYAYQALQCIPDNETLWQEASRRACNVILGLSGLVSAVTSLDLDRLLEGLERIQQGFVGASEVGRALKTAYKGVNSFAGSGQGFFECLKEGLSFSGKRMWYSALRAADVLIRDGRFADFRKLVCEVPCRRDAAFQWGICQRLGEIAANPNWDLEIRQSAIAFLGEIYRNDAVWGYQSTVKQWILNILMQLSTLPGDGNQCMDKRQSLFLAMGDEVDTMA